MWSVLCPSIIALTCCVSIPWSPFLHTLYLLYFLLSLCNSNVTPHNHMLSLTWYTTLMSPCTYDVLAIVQYYAV